MTVLSDKEMRVFIKNYDSILNSASNGTSISLYGRTLSEEEMWFAVRVIGGACRHCGRWRRLEHVDNKCLFGPTKYEAYPLETDDTALLSHQAEGYDR